MAVDAVLAVVVFLAFAVTARLLDHRQPATIGRPVITVTPEGPGTVRGSFALGFGGAHGVVDARRPAGGKVSGNLVIEDAPNRFSGLVTCVGVGEMEAVVGAVGRRAGARGGSRPWTAVVRTIDGRDQLSDVLDYKLDRGTRPPRCSDARFGEELPLERGDIAVTPGP